MVARILFVCAANICRSPTAQALAIERLEEESLGGFVTVVSAGTHAETGSAWCRGARDAGLVGPATEAVMSRHSSHLLSLSGIGKATLVVTADRLTSAEVIRIDPSVRTRLFTMREAAALSQKVVQASRKHVPAGEVRVPEHRLSEDADILRSRLEWLVGEMDASRGTISLLAERRRRRLLHTERVTVLDVDIPDAHVRANRIRHRKMLPILATAVGTLMDDVVYVLGRPAP